MGVIHAKLNPTDSEPNRNSSPGGYILEVAGAPRLKGHFYNVLALPSSLGFLRKIYTGEDASTGADRRLRRHPRDIGTDQYLTLTSQQQTINSTILDPQRLLGSCGRFLQLDGLGYLLKRPQGR